MRTSVTYKDILSIALPIMGGSIAENVSNTINTAFVGSIGEVSVGAVALGGLFYFGFAIIAIGLASGLQAIVGRRNGEENFEEAGNALTHGLILFCAISAIMLVCMYFSAPTLLAMFIHSNNVRNAIVGYLHIRQFGIIFLCMVVCFRSFYIGITNTLIITVISLLGMGLNILFDWLLIFGHGPFPALGINGAAYASIIAEVVSLSAYIIATFSMPAIRKYKPFYVSKFQLKYIAGILKTGAPLMLQSWISFSAWLFFFVLIENIGEQQLAVSAIIKSIYMLFLIPMWAFSAAGNSLTANTIGQGRSEEVMSLLNKIAWLATLVIIIPVVVCLVVPGPILSAYSNSAQIVSLGITPLRVISVAIFLFPFAFIYLGGVSGSGDTTMALKLEIGTIIVYVTYFWFMAKFLHATMGWIWTAEIVYMLLMGIGSYLRIRSGKWKGKMV